MATKDIEFLGMIIDKIRGNAFVLARDGISKMRKNRIPVLYDLCFRHYEHDEKIRPRMEKDFYNLKKALAAAEHYALRASKYKMPRDGKMIDSLKSKAISYCLEARDIFYHMEYVPE